MPKHEEISFAVASSGNGLVPTFLSHGRRHGCEESVRQTVGRRVAFE